MAEKAFKLKTMHVQIVSLIWLKKHIHHKLSFSSKAYQNSYFILSIKIIF
jgi:hypothetical protein